MKIRYLKITFYIMMGMMLFSCATPKGGTRTDKRNYVLKMKNETLGKLHAKRPETKEMIKEAAGYAAFSNINTNLFLLSTCRGYGVVIDNSTGKKTYMNMGQVGVGPGLGIKDFRAVLIFKNKEVLHEFIEKGCEFGGHADAAARGK